MTSSLSNVRSDATEHVERVRRPQGYRSSAFHQPSFPTASCVRAGHTYTVSRDCMTKTAIDIAKKSVPAIASGPSLTNISVGSS